MTATERYLSASLWTRPDTDVGACGLENHVEPVGNVGTYPLWIMWENLYLV